MSASDARDGCPGDELLAAFHAEAVSPDEETLVATHVERCEACRAALDDLRVAADALRALPLPQPSREARDRAYAAVMAAMSAAPGGQAGTGVEEAHHASRPRIARSDAPREREKNRRWTGSLLGFAAAAACLLIAAGTLFPGVHLPASAQREMAKAAPTAPPRDASREEDLASSKKVQAPPPVPTATAMPQAPLAEKPSAPLAPPRPAEAPGGAGNLARPEAENAPTAGAAPAAHEPARVDRDVERRAAIGRAREVLVEARLRRFAADEADSNAAGERYRRADAQPRDKAEGAPLAKNDSEKKAKDAKKESLSGSAAGRGPAAEPRATGETFALPDGSVLRDAAGDGTLVLEAPETKGGSGAIAAVSSHDALSDPRVVGALQALLDRALAEQPQDERWARRVVSLGRLLGLDRGASPEAGVERAAPSRR